MGKLESLQKYRFKINKDVILISDSSEGDKAKK